MKKGKENLLTESCANEILFWPFYEIVYYLYLNSKRVKRSTVFLEIEILVFFFFSRKKNFLFPGTQDLVRD